MGIKIVVRKKRVKTGRDKASKCKKFKPLTLLEQKHLSIMDKKTIDHEVKDKESDIWRIDRCGTSLFLRGGRCQIKHEINDILFKYQMQKLRRAPKGFQSTYPSSCATPLEHPPKQTIIDGWALIICHSKQQRLMISAPLNRYLIDSSFDFGVWRT